MSLQLVATSPYPYRPFKNGQELFAKDLNIQTELIFADHITDWDKHGIISGCKISIHENLDELGSLELILSRGIARLRKNRIIIFPQPIRIPIDNIPFKADSTIIFLASVSHEEGESEKANNNKYLEVSQISLHPGALYCSLARFDQRSADFIELGRIRFEHNLSITQLSEPTSSIAPESCQLDTRYVVWLGASVDHTGFYTLPIQREISDILSEAQTEIGATDTNEILLQQSILLASFAARKGLLDQSLFRELLMRLSIKSERQALSMHGMNQVELLELFVDLTRPADTPDPDVCTINPNPSMRSCTINLEDRPQYTIRIQFAKGHKSFFFRVYRMRNNSIRFNMDDTHSSVALHCWNGNILNKKKDYIVAPPRRDLQSLELHINSLETQKEQSRFALITVTYQSTYLLTVNLSSITPNLWPQD